MESLIYVVAIAVLYFIPYGLAKSRKHSSTTGIGLLNLFLGWSVIGWLVALIWAASGQPGETGPTPATHVKCPDCAELVLHQAKVCKHCGCKLIPQ
jgi:Na+/H+-dicarboxylate symporter